MVSLSLAIEGVVFIVGATFAAILSLELERRGKIPVPLGFFGLVVFPILAIVIFVWLHPPPDPVYTGEIIKKLFANGSALLDNGSMIAISDIPGVGCP